MTSHDVDCSRDDYSVDGLQPISGSDNRRPPSDTPVDRYNLNAFCGQEAANALECIHVIFLRPAIRACSLFRHTRVGPLTQKRRHDRA